MNPRSLGLGLLLSLSPLVARAHGALKSSNPARGARLAVAPTVLRLTFTEAPVLGFTRIVLTGPAGIVALGAMRVDSIFTVADSITGPLLPGMYAVEWQVAGKDGHPVRGRYTFTILPNATGLGITSLQNSSHGEAASHVPIAGHESREPRQHPESGGFDASSPAYVVARWLSFVGLLGVIGTVAFRFAVLPRYRSLAGAAADDAVASESQRRAAVWGAVAALLLTVAAVLRLASQSYAVHGGAKDFSLSLVWAMILHTLWGWGWAIQLVGALTVGIALLQARRSATGQVYWGVALIGAIVLAFTPGLAGHAIASPRLSGPAVLFDGLHVLGAGGWVGSLSVLLFAALPAAISRGAEQRGSAVASMVNAFSPTALGFAGVTALSGLFAAWLHLGGLSALWETGYGRTLLVKLAVLSLVAGTGAYNWLRVRPALGDDRGTSRIRRSATIEVIVAVFVLIVTAVLVATPTPVTAERNGAVRTSSEMLPSPVSVSVQQAPQWSDGTNRLMRQHLAGFPHTSVIG